MLVCDGKNTAISQMVLFDLGEITQKHWLEMPEHFPYVQLDAFSWNGQ
jgi:hypothetical protein